MQIQVKIAGILKDCGRKPGSNYPDLEPGPGTRFQLQITNFITVFAGNVT